MSVSRLKTAPESTEILSFLNFPMSLTTVTDSSFGTEWIKFRTETKRFV